jgi:hypothetical protein
MIQLLIALILTTSITQANSNSLAWWMLPSNSDDLPHEIEEDDNGIWNELWLRPYDSPNGAPTAIMEQGLGVRWVALNPDKDGKPTRVTLIVGGRHIVDFTGEAAKIGALNDEAISWSDGSGQKLIANKRKGHSRRSKKRTAVINFGKISMPPLTNKNKEISAWDVEGLNLFLNQIPRATDAGMSTRALSSVAQLSTPMGNLLGFRYSPHCSFENRQKIEDAFANEVEPKLTCWMQQNPEAAYKFLAVLMQKPQIDCRPQISAQAHACGQATLPVVFPFFASSPRITIATQPCTEELGNTLLHEIFHLAGIKDSEPAFLNAFQQSESCTSVPPELSFDEAGDSFYNDFQVETRIFLFRKVRDEASKWSWPDAERSFVLGSICAKMGDKFCARRFFQKASDATLNGSIELPEGDDVSWSSLAAFQLYDSISEELPRMHALVHYLHRDPNGALLRRLETGSHRLHELYLARQALEAVKNNRGICNGEVSEHIMCEDLATLVKAPWFKNP